MFSRLWSAYDQQNERVKLMIGGSILLAAIASGWFAVWIVWSIVSDIVRFFS